MEVSKIKISNRIQRYKEAKENRIKGIYNGAPLFYAFPRLGSSIPVIPKGKQIMMLGGSGLGKSQSWIGIILIPIYKLIKEYNYKAKFFIFLLEDPVELLEDRLFCNVLFRKFGLSIDPLELNSMREKPLGDDVIAKFDEVDKDVEEILSYCEIIDSVYNPTGIYKHLRTASAKLGTHTWKEKEFTYNKENGTTHKELVKVYDSYTPNDPELHVFVITDNLNNLQEEKGGDLRASMSRWARDYGRLQIVKHWNWTTVNIMQQAMETDRKQFDMRGESILEKLEPNLSSLGDNKIISRDHHIIFGLFSPARFAIDNYEGYNIKRIGDSFRSLIIIKTNISAPNVKFPFYFGGASSFFKELPRAKDMTEEVYKKIETKQIKDI